MLLDYFTTTELLYLSEERKKERKVIRIQDGSYRSYTCPNPRK